MTDLSTLRIVRYPDPILKKTCAPVEQFGEELRGLTERMLELMKQGGGIGLAGPQVGLLIRIFVCNATGEPQDDLVCVNPHLSDLCGAGDAEEGCLSIPGVTVTMRRATKATIKACDAEGRSFVRTGLDLVARVWQHEADHLEGRLITDHMSTADEISNRRALKQLRDDYTGGRRQAGARRQ
ncbi:MAG: peptide deformylase [Phycisphaerae bacterium]